MVTMMLHGGRSRDGIRPFDPYRDTRQVLDLMAEVFGGDLAPDEEALLARMRRFSRWNTLIWLFMLGWDARTAPGYVWVERGRIVGNVSLRRARSRWGGFLVGNVAVHPEWRGQGIARMLMEAVIEKVASVNGRWIGLEVEKENRVARSLYENLGFRACGETVHMLREAAPAPQPARSLRRARSHDGPALVALMQAVVPEPQRSLLERCRDDYLPGFERTLDLLLYGCREYWWVLGGRGELQGAVRLLHHWDNRPDTLEILVAPAHRGQVEGELARQGVGGKPAVARRKAIMAEVPGPSEPLLAALREVGFRERRRLVQMRLTLRSP